MSPDENKKWEQEVSGEFAEGLELVRRESAPPDSLERSLAAAERITMTSAAWKRGIKNAWMCGALVWTVQGGLALVINWLTQQGMTLSFVWAFGVSWVIAFTGFCASWIVGLIARGTTGEMLLDCGPHPTRKLFLLYGATFAIGGVASGLASGGWTGVALSLFFVSFSVYWFIASTGRLRFYQSGIWQYWGLLPWDKIKSVRWQEGQDTTLLIQAKARFPILGRGALPVATEQKASVQQLLIEKLPADAMVLPLADHCP